MGLPAMDAKVVGNTKVWNTSNNTDKFLRPSTHTPPDTDKPDLASHPRSPTHPSTLPQDLPPNLSLLSLKDQFPLPLRPTEWLSKLHRWYSQHLRLRNQPRSRHHRRRIWCSRWTTILHRQK